MNKIIITIGCVFILALGLRLYNFNKYDLWFDELVTDMFSSQYLTTVSNISGVSKTTIFQSRIRNDPHSSLYFSLSHIYSIFFGDGKSLRILSILFSMFALGVFYKLSRLFFDQRTSIYALFIMAINPFHIWYAQEARAYAMASFFSLALIYIYMRALKFNKQRHWIFFSITGIFAVASSYHCGFLLMATGLPLFFKRNHFKVKKWFISLFVVFIFLLFFKSLLSDQLSFVKNDFWLSSPTEVVLLFTWKVFTLGYSVDGGQYALGLGLFFSLFVYGVFHSWRRNRINTMIILAFLFLPIMATYFFSKYIMPIYVHRQLIIVSPFIYLFVAKGLDGLRNSYIQKLACISIIVMTGISLGNYYQGIMPFSKSATYYFGGAPQKRNYQDLLEGMKKKFKEGDRIVTTDLDSYMIVYKHIINNYKKYGDIASKGVHLLHYPVLLPSFEKRFLNVNKQIGKLSKKEMGDIYRFIPRVNGITEIDKMQIDKNYFSRIWLVSSSGAEGIGVSRSSVAVTNYFLEKRKRIFFRERVGIQISLFK